MIAVWIAGALISLLGALCYAELASAFPSAGGDYHFLTCAYGPNLLVLTVAIAALASINATLIVSARSNCSVARDWALLHRFGVWSEHNNAPVAAYLLQALVALLLVRRGRKPPSAARKPA